MSSSQNIAKCDCCGKVVNSDVGFIINSSLSRKFADKIARAEEKRGTLMKLAPKLVELRMKQVFTCSEECVSRIIDSKKEKALARRAAKLWCQVRNPTAELNSSEDVFITAEMLDRSPAEVQAALQQASSGPAQDAQQILGSQHPAVMTSDHGQSSGMSSSKKSRGIVAAASQFFTTTTGIAVAGGSAVVVLIVALLVIPFGDSGSSDGKSGKNKKDSDGPVSRVNAGDVNLPEATTGLCRVYSSEAGFQVVVDGFPVRDSDGELIETPCAVMVAQGTHTVTVTKAGFYDASRNVLVGKDSEVVFDVRADENGGATRIVDSMYYSAETGKPIELTSLNTDGAEIDPFVTSDGLSIWFASDRPEGKGIFYATRASKYDPFEEPEMLEMTRRGFDMPGSPSVTGDGLSVIYSIPAKARIFSITRPNPLADFAPKIPVKHSQAATTPYWMSAQILSDGLRVYWSEQKGDEVRTLAMVRKADAEDFSASKTLKVDLPGIHPCLSADGLRQYSFDGKTVSRAIRSKPSQKFSNPETVIEIELPNYKRSEKHRQYFVLGDEQWLFYSDDPVTSGDLFMVRLSDGSEGQLAVIGKSIPERVVVAETTSDPADTKMSENRRPVIDPLSLPLPYTSFWDKYTTMLAERQYKEAKSLIQKSQSDSRFSEDLEFLKWDQAELKNITVLWSKLRSFLDGLKPGDIVQIGNAKAEFVSFEEGALLGTLNGKEFMRNFDEMPADDVLKLADQVIEKSDSLGQLQIGTFLYYDATADPLKAETRLERAGDEGQVLIEQQGRRKLQQAKQELKRDKFSEAIGFIDFISIVAPDSGIDREAKQLRASLYEYIKWQPIGGRTWETANGEYAADYSQQRNSALLAPQKYKNFELSMEWKATAQNGAGGVIFRYSGQGDFDGVTNQYKIYLANDYNVNPDKFSTGALFRRSEPTENNVNQMGEWNTFKMRVTQGGVRVEVTINDKLVLRTTAPDPNIPFNGYVALDGSIGGITYRKMLINELPENRSADE